MAQGGGFPRIINRSKTTSATFTPASVILKTTAYESWEHLKRIIGPLLQFVEDRLLPDGFSRIGLRYIDEIHVQPEDGVAVDWSRYLTSTLPSASASGVLREDLAERRSVLCRRRSRLNPQVRPC